MRIRQIVIAAGLAAAALGVTAVAPAQAQGGCGPYAHRGWDGWCHPGGGWGGPRHFSGGYGHGWHRPWSWHHPGWGYDHRG